MIRFPISVGAVGAALFLAPAILLIALPESSPWQFQIWHQCVVEAAETDDPYTVEAHWREAGNRSFARAQVWQHRMVDLDPPRAYRMAAEQSPQAGTQVLCDWALRDPMAAFAALQARGPMEDEPRAGGLLRWHFGDTAYTAITRILLQRDPEKVDALIPQMPDWEGRNARMMRLTQLAQSDPMEVMDRSRSLDIFDAIDAVLPAARTMGKRHGEKALVQLEPFIARLNAEEKDRGFEIKQVRDAAVAGWAEEDAQGALAWAHDHRPEDRNGIVEEGLLGSFQETFVSAMRHHPVVAIQYLADHVGPEERRWHYHVIRREVAANLRLPPSHFREGLEKSGLWESDHQFLGRPEDFAAAHQDPELPEVPLESGYFSRLATLTAFLGENRDSAILNALWKRCHLDSRHPSHWQALERDVILAAWTEWDPLSALARPNFVGGHFYAGSRHQLGSESVIADWFRADPKTTVEKFEHGAFGLATHYDEGGQLFRFHAAALLAGVWAESDPEAAMRWFFKNGTAALPAEQPHYGPEILPPVEAVTRKDPLKAVAMWDQWDRHPADDHWLTEIHFFWLGRQWAADDAEAAKAYHRDHLEGPRARAFAEGARFPRPE